MRPVIRRHHHGGWRFSISSQCGSPWIPARVAASSTASRSPPSCVDEMQIERLLARIDPAVRERPHLVFRQLTTLGDCGDELCVHVGEQSPRESGVPRRSSQRSGDPMSLNFPALMTTPCTPSFFRSSVDVAGLHDHADRAGERAGIGDDRVAGAGDVVAARRPPRLPSDATIGLRSRTRSTAP